MHVTVEVVGEFDLFSLCDHPNLSRHGVVRERRESEHRTP